MVDSGFLIGLTLFGLIAVLGYLIHITRTHPNKEDGFVKANPYGQLGMIIDFEDGRIYQIYSSNKINGQIEFKFTDDTTKAYESNLIKPMNVNEIALKKAPIFIYGSPDQDVQEYLKKIAEKNKEINRMRLKHSEEITRRISDIKEKEKRKVERSANE